MALRMASSRLESHADAPAVGHLGLRRFHESHYLQKAVGGRKRRSRSALRAGKTRRRRTRTPTRLPRRRQNVKAGSGETAAGAAGAVGMETAGELARERRADAFKFT